MKNDRKHSQASTRRRIAGAAATLSVLAGVVGLESGALAAPSSNAVQVTNATMAASIPTFSVSAPSNTTATVTWTNLTPTMIGRNGVDSSGTGAWNTGSAGVPAAALGARAFTFTRLVPGDSYTYTVTKSDGTTQTTTLTQPGGSTTPVVTPPVVTPPVVTPPVVTPVATPTFSVSAPSNTTATVTWTNLTPTMIGRNGVDSSGTGAWNTGSAGVPAAALGARAFTFTRLVPGDSYTYTVTKSDGTTQTTTLTQPGGSTTPVVTPPVVTPPVVTPPVVTPPVVTPPFTGAVAPMTPASLGAPTHVILDEEFNTGSLNTSLWSPNWFVNGTTQNGTVMESSNVSVGANGLNLKLNSNSTGAIVSSNPNGGAGTGFQVAPTAGHPVYVEYTATLPSSGSAIANWPGLWLTGQSWPATGEIDVMEGFGTSQFHIEYGPAGSGFGSGVQNPGGVGGTTAGTHTYGVLWSTTGVTFVYDGVVVGSETAALSGPMYLVMENSLGNPSVLNATMTVRDVRVWQ